MQYQYHLSVFSYLEGMRVWTGYFLSLGSRFWAV